MRATYALAAATLVFGSAPALAGTAPFPPAHDKICSTPPLEGSSAEGGVQVVDRVKLADYLLIKYPLSIRAMPKNGSPGTTDIGVYILGHIEEICVKKGDCSAADQTNADGIRGNLFSFLLSTNQKDSYVKPAGLSPSGYFLAASGQQVDIQCVFVDSRPVNPPGAVLDEPEKITSPIRIRGKVDDLYIDRSEDSFKSASQATISFASDAIAGKSTETVQGVVGYVIPTDWLKAQGQYANLVPYLQVNHSIVEPTNGSSVKTSRTDTYSVGVMGSFYFRTGGPYRPIGHFINIRPDYLVNRIDQSAIASLNFQYVPIVNQRVNSFIDGFSPFLYKWIFDVRVDSGSFTDRGLLAVTATNKDYLRAGGQVGLALTTRGDQLPMSFSSTYTSLYSLRGDVDIGYFANSFTYYFDPKKYLGFTVTYTNGRREDTAKRERQVSAGLSSKF